ncbi:MAG: hypothetical protein U1F43_25965 [Myxococcota bacterium]
MVYLLTFVWCLPSGFLWLFNGEAMVVLQVTQNPDAAPWAIALCATTAQFIGYAVLYHFAGRVLTRFAFVRRSVEKVKEKTKLEDNVGWGSMTIFGTGGVIGVPPLLGLFTLYGSARAGPLLRLIAVAAPLRLVWYLTWAYAPDFLRQNFGCGH